MIVYQIFTQYDPRNNRLGAWSNPLPIDSDLTGLVGPQGPKGDPGSDGAPLTMVQVFSPPQNVIAANAGSIDGSTISGYGSFDVHLNNSGIIEHVTTNIGGVRREGFRLKAGVYTINFDLRFSAVEAQLAKVQRVDLLAYTLASDGSEETVWRGHVGDPAIFAGNAVLDCRIPNDDEVIYLAAIAIEKTGQDLTVGQNFTYQAAVSIIKQDGAVGPTGPQGPAGADGAPVLRWRGPWQPNTVYAQNDAVSYQGSSYFIRSPTTSNASLTPPAVPSIYGVLAQKGADGAQGPQGPQGQLEQMEAVLGVG